MKDRNYFFWIFILGVVLGIHYINYNKYVSSNNEILALTKKIDSLKASTENLQIDRDSLSTITDILSDSIQVQNIKIDSLKNIKNETISNISSFSTSDIDQFFANRYGYVIRSIPELCSERDS